VPSMRTPRALHCASFTNLLGCSARSFIEEVCGTSHVFNSQGAKVYLKELPSLDRLDSLYFSLELAGARLGIVDGHAAPSSGTPLVRTDGRVALDEVHSAYCSGKTILLTHLQNSHLGVARFARALESELHENGFLFR
jgi:hypothetical protein